MSWWSLQTGTSEYTSTAWGGGHFIFVFHDDVYQLVQVSMPAPLFINTLRPRQNGRHFANDIFKCIFLNKNFDFDFTEICS